MLLFDDEEIHEDLHLMVAESPDESQIVVYGEVYVAFTVISARLVLQNNNIKCRNFSHFCTCSYT